MSLRGGWFAPSSGSRWRRSTAAGIAWLNFGAGVPLADSTAAAETVPVPGVRLSRHWRITRTVQPARTLLTDTSSLGNPAVVLGHARHATQGDPRALANAAPIRAGHVIGCHNGDVDVRTVAPLADLSLRKGETDSEALLLALSATDPGSDAAAEVLARVVGRVALVWVDLRTPTWLYLARGGLSPLALGYDRRRNLMRASNPAWLRAEVGSAAALAGILVLSEGTVVAVDIGSGAVASVRTFVPTVRRSDLAQAEHVWKGFSADDRAHDRAASVHRVLQHQ